MNLANLANLENPILTFKNLFWHSDWVGKSYLTFKILFCHSVWIDKSYFDSKNPILILRMSKKDFECQNWIFRLIANVKIGFWMSKWDFPTHSECRKTKNKKRKPKKPKAKKKKKTIFKPTSPCWFSIFRCQQWSWNSLETHVPDLS